MGMHPELFREVIEVASEAEDEESIEERECILRWPRI
jgi:hypothetical protein